MKSRGAEPTLGIRGLRPVVSGLRVLGYDPLPLLASVGLDKNVLDDPDGRVPAGAVIEMLARAVELTGDGDLGLHLAERAALVVLSGVQTVDGEDPGGLPRQHLEIGAWRDRTIDRAVDVNARWGDGAQDEHREEDAHGHFAMGSRQ